MAQAGGREDGVSTIGPTANWIQCKFQKEMLECTNEDQNCLLVMAKGLGMGALIKTLVSAYASEKTLVFLLNASREEEEGLREIFADCDPDAPTARFNIIKSDAKNTTAPTAAQRQEIYLRGGVISVTKRIMVVDLLKGRIPAHLITGIVIKDAHMIREHSLESFILTLFRRSNTVGFIKAFSEDASLFTGSMNRIEKMCKWMKVDVMHLFPRFHMSIKSDLNALASLQIAGIEVEMSAKMKIIQMALLDLVHGCMRELIKSNPTTLTPSEADDDAFDFAAIETGGMTMAEFEQLIRAKLDPIWYKVSAKSRQLIREVKLLLLLLCLLIEVDAEGFEKFMECVVMADVSALGRAYWLLMDSSKIVLRVAKERACSEKEMPKWTILNRQILQKNKNLRTLVVVREEHTVGVLNRLLCIDGHDGDSGSEQTSLEEWRERLKDISGIRHGIDLSSAAAPSKRSLLPLSDVSEGEEIDEAEIKVKVKVAAGPVCEPKKGHSSRKTGSGDTVPVTIKSFADIGPDPIAFLNNNPFDQIVLFDTQLAFIRAIEMHGVEREARQQASHHPLSIITLHYRDGVDENRQLLEIRREKKAFESLINSKSKMVSTREKARRDGGGGGGSRSSEDEDLASGMLSFGGGKKTGRDGNKRIIVDMREFSSSLPFILYKRGGFEIVPLTLTVGDYILNEVVVIERKSVPDLMQSLNNGRLYTQIQAMTTKSRYKACVLLIEFEKTFSLLSTESHLDNSSNSQFPISETIGKLVLLLLHFPQTRIIWSTSPAATVDIFGDLKIAFGGDDENGEDFGVDFDESSMCIDSVAQDMLLALPGITQSNHRLISKHTKNMHELCTMSKIELSDLIGQKSAGELFSFLHARSSASSSNDNDNGGGGGSVKGQRIKTKKQRNQARK